MRTLLVDNGSGYIKKLKGLTKANKLISWDKLDPRLSNNYDLIVLSGGHLFPILRHDKDFSQEIRMIKKINKPIIGICLGSELIAHVYGAKLLRMKHKEHRIIKITENKQLFKVFENHRWVIKHLPNNLVALARSKDGIEIFRHKTKPIFGIQFHPEVLVSKTYGRTLFRNILKTLSIPQN